RRDRAGRTVRRAARPRDARRRAGVLDTSEWSYARGAATVPSASMHVEVIRSPRRRRTVQAQMMGNVLRLSIPATMTRAEEQHWIQEMTRRLSQRKETSDRELARRAAGLAARYGLPEPGSVRWVRNQHRRWGRG